jgi:hypothetical protein
MKPTLTTWRKRADLLFKTLRSVHEAVSLLGLAHHYLTPYLHHWLGNLHW